MLSVNSECPCGIPVGVFDALKGYVVNHRAPGYFLEVVLSNNLIDAVTAANDENLCAITTIARYIRDWCPSACWGSQKTVEAWIAIPNSNHQRLRLVK